MKIQQSHDLYCAVDALLGTSCSVLIKRVSSFCPDEMGVLILGGYSVLIKGVSSFQGYSVLIKAVSSFRGYSVLIKGMSSFQEYSVLIKGVSSFQGYSCTQITGTIYSVLLTKVSSVSGQFCAHVHVVGPWMVSKLLRGVLNIYIAETTVRKEELCLSEFSPFSMSYSLGRCTACYHYAAIKVNLQLSSNNKLYHLLSSITHTHAGLVVHSILATITLAKSPYQRLP